MMAETRGSVTRTEKKKERGKMNIIISSFFLIKYNPKYVHLNGILLATCSAFLRALINKTKKETKKHYEAMEINK